MEKSNTGITLIALIITIVVLLILAGVTISAITGNESAMQKAVEAKEKTDISAELEEIKLAVVNAISKDTMGDLKAENLIIELENLVEDTSVITENAPYNVIGKKTKSQYEIDESGDVKLDNNKLFLYNKGKEDSIFGEFQLAPNGLAYYYSTNGKVTKNNYNVKLEQYPYGTVGTNINSVTAYFPNKIDFSNIKEININVTDIKAYTALGIFSDFGNSNNFYSRKLASIAFNETGIKTLELPDNITTGYLCLYQYNSSAPYVIFDKIWAEYRE